VAIVSAKPADHFRSSRAGDPAMVSGYAGNGSSFDEAIAGLP
jgi:hypothetical protein